MYQFSCCQLLVWPGERWVMQGLFSQDKLHMNEYISAFETRYVKGIGQVLTDPMTIPCYRTDDNLCTISSCWNLVILTCSSSHIMRSANFQTLIHYSKMFVFIFRGLLIFWDVSFDSINEIKSSFPNQLGPLLIVIVNNMRKDGLPWNPHCSNVWKGRRYMYI